VYAFSNLSHKREQLHPQNTEKTEAHEFKQQSAVRKKKYLKVFSVNLFENNTKQRHASGRQHR
jgi:hypothetical protein